MVEEGSWLGCEWWWRMDGLAFGGTRGRLAL